MKSMEISTHSNEEKSEEISNTSKNHLLQYVALAKNANESTLIDLIKQILEHPQIYVFGEMLELQNVQNLKNTEYLNWFNLLQLFAYGKVKDYDSTFMPELTEIMIKKLRHLTIITLTSSSRRIPYSVLLNELKVSNLRDVEDLIIEAIYANLIKGKLEQKTACLEVDSTIARDVRPEKIDDITAVLTSCLTNCENVLSSIDQQIKLANDIKAENLNKMNDLDNYISLLKKKIIKNL